MTAETSLQVGSRLLVVQSAGVEMTFLSDVVSVAFVRDLITWTTTDAILSQLTSPVDLGVYLCGEPPFL